MKEEISEVSLQGIEFWSNVCEEELNLAVEMEEVKVLYIKLNIFKKF